MTKHLSNEEILFYLSESHPDSAKYFEILYDRFQPELIRYFQNKGLDFDTAQDLVQQTLIQIFEKRSQYRQNTPAKAWIFVIARSRFLDWYRSYKNKLKYESQFNLNVSYNRESFMETQEQDFLSHWELTKEEVELLTARLISGFTFEEIAQSSGLKASTLRKRVSRLYQQIKNKLKS